MDPQKPYKVAGISRMAKGNKRSKLARELEQTRRKRQRLEHQKQILACGIQKRQKLIEELEMKMVGLKRGQDVAHAGVLDTTNKLATLEKTMSEKSVELDQIATIDLNGDLVESAICSLKGTMTLVLLRSVSKHLRDLVDRMTGSIGDEKHPRRKLLRPGDVVTSLKMNTQGGFTRQERECLKNSKFKEVREWYKSRILKCVVIRKEPPSVFILVKRYELQPLLPEGTTREVFESITKWRKCFRMPRNLIWAL